MNFFNYFIKCIIRKFVNLIFKPKIFVLLCILIFIMSFFYGYNQAFATDVTNDVIYVDVINVDNIQNMDNLQNINTIVSTGDYLQIELAKAKTSQLKFIQIMTKYYQQNGRFPDIFETYMRQFFINNYLFMFTTNQTEYTTVATSRTALYIFYTNSSNVTGDIHDEEFIFNGSAEGDLKYSLACQDYTGNLYSYTYNYPNEVQESFVGGHTISIPSGVEGYYCNELIQFFYDVDNGDFYDKNTENYLNDINNSINETNNFLTDSSVSEGTVNIIEDTNQDITDFGFNNSFNILMNAFLSDEKRNIEIPMPYSEKKIVIKSDFLYDFLGENSWVLYIVQLFYYYLVGNFIVSDVHRIIEKVKTGDIMTSSEGNIKADMV